MTISQNTQIQKITANSIIGVVTDFNSAVLSTAYSKATYHSGSYPKFTGTATYGISGNQSPASTTTGWTNPNAIPTGQLDNKSNNPQLPGITDCLTYIPNDIKLELNPLNVTVSGTPTNNKGVVSGFSATNYLKLPKLFNPSSANNWEIVLKFKISAFNTASTWVNLLGNGDATDRTAGVHIFYNTSGNVRLEACTLGATTWDICNITGNSVMSLNTDYWVKAEFTGSAYNIYISTDGKTFNIEGSVSSTSKIGASVIQCLGNTLSHSSYFHNGSIDLTQSYIKVDGSTWWKGGTGQLTLKKGSKVYIPNAYSGTKYYKYTYENWTQPTLSADGTLGSSDYACYSSKGVYSNLNVYNAFNDNTTPYHSASGSSPYEVIFYSKTPLKPSKINIRNRSNDSSYVYPVSSLTVYGSNDGSSFTQIGYTTNSVTTAGGSWSCSVSTNIPYKYFKFKFASSHSYFAMDYIGIVAQAQTGVVESTSSDYDYKVDSGTKKFDEVVISKDLTISIANNNKFFIFYNLSTNGLWFSDTTATRSGETNPSDLWGFFYNITDNKVYYLRNGTTPDNLTFSLPIAAVISNGTSITSINQTFNGMGYIGSTMFVLPGIKGIIPNGSTNINYENTTVALITVGTPGARDLFIKSNNALVDRYYHNQTTQPTITWCAWYNPSTNTYKESTSDSAVFTDEQMLFIANFTDDNASPQSKITSLTPRPLTSTTITASTLWNSMLNLTRTLVKIRKFTSNWYHKTDSTNNLVNTITSYATFNTYYPSLTSATLAVNVKGEYWTRSGSTSVTISPTSVLKNNTTATSENINTAINNCYNAWVSTCYNANVLTYTFYTCHQNCHSQCHDSRGRR